MKNPLEQVKKLIINCKYCGPEYENHSAYGFGKEKNPFVFFVGINPWIQEIVENKEIIPGQPRKFCLRQGRGLKILLSHFEEWGFEDYYLDNLIKCQIPNKGKYSVKEAKNCVLYLQAQIKIIKPKYVFLFGQFVCDQLKIKYLPFKRQGNFLALPHFSSILYGYSQEKEKNYYEKLKRTLNKIKIYKEIIS